MLARVFIHEYLHAKDTADELTEKEIERRTEIILRALSNEECRRLGKLIIESVRRRQHPT